MSAGAARPAREIVALHTQTKLTLLVGDRLPVTSNAYARTVFVPGVRFITAVQLLQLTPGVAALQAALFN